MNDALNTPVRRARKEVSSGDMPLGQMDSMDLPDIDDPLDHVREIEPVDETVLQKLQIEALAFNEDPLRVYINTAQEKNPPVVIDCWVNGRGAEVWVAGQWHVFGCLPIGREVVTKRKYVEALLMAKTTGVTTDTGTTMDEKPRNSLVFNTSARVNINIIADRSPKGREWLRRVMALKN